MWKNSTGSLEARKLGIGQLPAASPFTSGIIMTGTPITPLITLFRLV
jgi:hypothetical protein